MATILIMMMVMVAEVVVIMVIMITTTIILVFTLKMIAMISSVATRNRTQDPLVPPLPLRTRKRERVNNIKIK